MPATWEVWSVDVARGSGLAVDEGTKAHATNAAARRNQAAVKNGMRTLVFIAVPAGQQPSLDEAQRLIAEREAAG